MELNDFDLAKTAEEGAQLELKHPSSGTVLISDVDGKPIVITLKGAESASFKRAAAEVLNLQNNSKKINVAETERKLAEVFARITIGISDNLTWGGEPFQFSQENIKRLYTERPWIRQQVDAFVGDLDNFFKRGLQG